MTHSLNDGCLCRAIDVILELTEQSTDRFKKHLNFSSARRSQHSPSSTTVSYPCPKIPSLSGCKCSATSIHRFLTSEILGVQKPRSRKSGADEEEQWRRAVEKSGGRSLQELTEERLMLNGIMSENVRLVSFPSLGPPHAWHLRSQESCISKWLLRCRSSSFSIQLCILVPCWATKDRHNRVFDSPMSSIL